MLTEDHLTAYRLNLLEAAGDAHVSIQAAEEAARRVACGGCRYCLATARHKSILRITLSELLSIVNNLHEGEVSKQSFPKKMFPGITLYRGFITHEGEYVSLFNSDHDTFREEYKKLHGEERAFQMITVHSSNLRNQIHFVDRKWPPTEQQYATLRNLLIDAEGSLQFRFSYDTTHPIVKLARH